ncbi:Glutaredoxin-like domain [Micrococcales bacterium KH10]|nr:Glutaredoxin-like domain [Micrococcales bacterium KH10]
MDEQAIDEPLVQLLVRANCSLCGPARDVVRRVCDDLGVAWQTRDISEPELAEAASRWSDMVPVVLVGGVPQGFWTIDERRLAHAIRSELGADDPEGGGGSTRRLRA